MKFRDRAQAGQLLAAELSKYRGGRPAVLALPRGGVAVGYEVAKALDAPLDVLVVRKLGVPWQPELGMGAIAEGGGVYLNRETVQLTDVGQADLQAVVDAETRELRRRIDAYRGDRALPPLARRTAILVDDGIATGGTMIAAIDSLRRLGAGKVVVAVPVSSPEAAHNIRPLVDDLVVLEEPEAMYAIGAWYEDFSQLGDEDVTALLARAAQQQAKAEGPERGGR